MKKEILSPRPHRARGAGGEGAVEGVMHNLGIRIARSFNEARTVARVLFICLPRMVPADENRTQSSVREKPSFYHLR